MAVREIWSVKARARGFTLIELLVVLVILGLLAGLVGPQVMKYLGESKTKTARLQITDLAAAMDLFHLDVGRYPTGSEGLASLVDNPGNLASWNGPYLKKRQVPKDPWGFDYHYRIPGERGSFDIFTYGADNAMGGQGEGQDVYSGD